MQGVVALPLDCYPFRRCRLTSLRTPEPEGAQGLSSGRPQACGLLIRPASVHTSSHLIPKPVSIHTCGSPCVRRPALAAWASVGLSPGLTPLSPLWICALCCPGSMKGKNTRLHNATRAELWQRFQRPLNDLQLWKALAQRLLDITASLPDLASIHTFLPQIEVTRLRGAGEATGSVCGISAALSGTNPFPGL